MSEFGALQSGSQDAGSWQLIEQTADDEWAPVARGGKLQIVRLAARLNGAAPQLPPAAADQEARDTGVPRVISHEEVSGWTADEYLQRRARLWSEKYGDYRDGSAAGRQYTTPAAALMTGPKEKHPAFGFKAPEYPRPLLTDRIQAAEAARDVAQSWRAAAHDRGLQKDVRNVWPGLGAQLDKLADEWADKGTRP